MTSRGPFQPQPICDSVIEAKDDPKESAFAQIYIALMFPLQEQIVHKLVKRVLLDNNALTLDYKVKTN